MIRVLAAGAALMAWATPAWSQAPLDPQSEAAQSPNAAQLDAGRALEALDLERLVSDRGYAETSLRHVELLSPLAAGDPGRMVALEGIRALVLATLQRGDESRAAIQRILAAGLPDAHPHALAWGAASHVPDVDLMLSVLEAVARNVPAADRASILPAFAPVMLHSISHEFRLRGDETRRIRLAETLAALNWPDHSEPESRDVFRKQLLDHRLNLHRGEEAAQIAATITTPAVALSLVLLRRYDGLLIERGRPQQTLERLLAAQDAATATLLAERPQDFGRVLARASYLRSVGRDDEALTALSPFLRDIAATSAYDAQGAWLVNEAGFALLALGRPDEAINLMSRLVALDFSTAPDLMGPSINYAAMLWQAGRAVESLAHVERLDAIADRYANAYGKMWISSTAVCSLAALGRNEPARARVRLMQERSDDNPAALTRALLCMNDLDAAERLVVARLQGEQPDEAMIALQDYRAGSADAGPTAVLFRRLLQLRDRPIVHNAIDRVGRVITLPVARTYYGGF